MVAKLLQESSARSDLLDFEDALYARATPLLDDGEFEEFYEKALNAHDLITVGPWGYDRISKRLINFVDPECIPMDENEAIKLAEQYVKLEDAVAAERWDRYKSSQDNFRSRYQSDLDLEGITGDFDKHIFVSRNQPQTPEPTLEDKQQYKVYTSGEYFFIKMPADPDFLQWEGINQQHCLSCAHRDYAERMKKGEIELYSLVKPDGKPAVDIEVAIARSSYGGPVKEPVVYQVRGPRNQCPPDDAYIPALMDFFTNYGKNWNLTGHGLGNFDGKRDGNLVAERFRQLKTEK